MWYTTFGGNCRWTVSPFFLFPNYKTVAAHFRSPACGAAGVSSALVWPGGKQRRCWAKAQRLHANPPGRREQRRCRAKAQRLHANPPGRREQRRCRAKAQRLHANHRDGESKEDAGLKPSRYTQTTGTDSAKKMLG